MALRARSFQMEVWAADPLLERWPEEFVWVKRVELPELLAGCHVISMHVPLDPTTRGLIGAAELAQMKPDSVLVNAALLEALKAGKIRGAILDVFATEPAPADHPLLALPNVLATPHLGASTAEVQRRAGDDAAAILIEALAKR